MLNPDNPNEFVTELINIALCKPLYYIDRYAQACFSCRWLTILSSRGYVLGQHDLHDSAGIWCVHLCIFHYLCLTA